MKIAIAEDWKKILASEFEKDYFSDLAEFVKSDFVNETCYPKGSDIFAAFDACSFTDLSVVILGQDPYHGPEQANGLSFSVPEGMKFPPSLVNIFKELMEDLGAEKPTSGDLTPWAKQGVMLLNSTLTVRAHEAGSHQKQGWEKFTDKVIEEISSQKENVVFILWGSYAQKKGKIIDREKHLVIESPHPSPLSSYRGFFGSKPFSKTNNYLKEKGLKQIDWRLE